MRDTWTRVSKPPFDGGSSRTGTHHEADALKDKATDDDIEGADTFGFVRQDGRVRTDDQ